MSPDILSMVTALQARVGEFNVRLGDTEDRVRVVDRRMTWLIVAVVLSAVNFLLSLVLIAAKVVA